MWNTSIALSPSVEISTRSTSQPWREMTRLTRCSRPSALFGNDVEDRVAAGRLVVGVNHGRRRRDAGATPVAGRSVSRARSRSVTSMRAGDDAAEHAQELILPRRR